MSLTPNHPQGLYHLLNQTMIGEIGRNLGKPLADQRLVEVWQAVDQIMDQLELYIHHTLYQRHQYLNFIHALYQHHQYLHFIRHYRQQQQDLVCKLKRRTNLCCGMAKFDGETIHYRMLI